jgi:streptomycin 6-kinase
MRAVRLGDSGRDWLDRLHDEVASLEEQWSMRVGDVHDGGSESLVAAVRLRDDTQAVLKVGLPGSADLAQEARVYTLADGRGYARLLAYDADRNAVLLERLGETLAQTEHSTDAQMRIICATLATAWLPLDGPSGLMTGAAKTQWLADFIVARWNSMDVPFATTVRDRALHFCAQRQAAYTPRHAVLVHGDAHSLNTLQVPGAPGQFKFIDPDGLFAERACDLATLMRDWSAPLLAGNAAYLLRARCDLLAQHSGVEAQPIWQWGFVERVSTGLMLMEIGLHEEGEEMLRVAELVSAEEVT